MRNLLQVALVIGVCGLCFARQMPQDLSLEGKAQRLVDQIYGPGHAQATVTVKRGHGQRTVRGTTFGEKGSVVSRQSLREGYQKAGGEAMPQETESCCDDGGESQGKYINEKCSEKFELPHESTLREETEWIERTSVAVVIDSEPTCEAEEAIAAGLGLDVAHGDLISVIQKIH